MTSAEAPPDATHVPAVEDVHNAIVATGINQTGLAEVSRERWVELAEAGCRQGAWDTGIARTLATAFLNSVASETAVPLDLMTQTVWLVTVTGCRDRVPPAALERGPPFVGGR